MLTGHAQAVDSEPLATIEYTNGLCGAACYGINVLYEDGTIHQGSETKHASAADLRRMKSLIEKANFDSIKSQPFTGRCPTASNGQERTYTFYMSDGKSESLRSCKYVINPKSDPFATLHRILESKQ